NGAVLRKRKLLRVQDRLEAQLQVNVLLARQVLRLLQHRRYVLCQKKCTLLGPGNDLRPGAGLLAAASHEVVGDLLPAWPPCGSLGVAGASDVLDWGPVDLRAAGASEVQASVRCEASHAHRWWSRPKCQARTAVHHDHG